MFRTITKNLLSRKPSTPSVVPSHIGNVVHSTTMAERQQEMRKTGKNPANTPDALARRKAARQNEMPSRPTPQSKEARAKLIHTLHAAKTGDTTARPKAAKALIRLRSGNRPDLAQGVHRTVKIRSKFPDSLHATMPGAATLRSRPSNSSKAKKK